MRRYITYLLLLAAPLAMAQTVTGVRLTGDGAAAKDGGATYEVSYEISLPQPKSDYSYTVTPVFRHGNDSLTDTPVTVRGRLNAKKLRRATVLGDAEAPMPPYIKAGEDSVVRRVITVSAAEYPWIKGGNLTLCTRIEGEGCCEILETRYVCGDSFRCPIPFVPSVADVPDNTGKAGLLERNNPVLRHISQYKPYDSTRILRKEKGALYVFFPLDKWTLRHDYRGNAATLDTIVSITRQIMADTTSSVKVIQIVGLASPEGSVARNNLLGQNRAVALRNYIQSRVSVPDTAFELCNGGEAWTELRSQVEELDMEGRDQLLGIIDNEPDPDVRERKMKRLNGGRTYRYLKDNVLSDQRNSGYIRIYYDYVPDSAAAVINKASALLRREKYQEALDTLEPVRHDTRSLNAQGVALYMTGRKEEALNCFRRGAELGDKQAKDNLTQLTR